MSAAHGEAVLGRKPQADAGAAIEPGGGMKLDMQALAADGDDAVEHVAEKYRRLDGAGDGVRVALPAVGQGDVLRPYRHRDRIAIGDAVLRAALQGAER